MHIPSHIKDVLDILYKNEYEGYLVGGCVRDALMGIAPHDFDITTSATPDEMLIVFKDFRIIETGLKHGTVTVVSDGENVEITTYRIDGDYIDNRRPSEVTFTRNLKEDLSRRDFTVNALAYNHKDGVVDMFDSQNDLEKGIIRCVGDPDTRFSEDGLRILRALRFSSCLSFDIHKGTSESIHRKMHLLSNISAERIYAELKKLVCGKKADSVIREYSEIFFYLFESVSKDKVLFLNNASKLSSVIPDYKYRLTALLWGFDDGAVSEFMNSLKPDKESLNFVRKICSYHGKKINSDKILVRKLMSELSDDEMLCLCDILKTFDENFNSDEFTKCFDRQKDENFCVRINQLAVKGDDLISFGIPKGKKIGETMKKILDAVIEEKCRNDYNSIKEYVLSL